MKFQFIVFSIAIIASSLARANFSTDCKFAYRTSSQDLVKAILEFKDKKTLSRDLGLSAAAIDFQVAGLRGACYFAEPSENRPCVEKYLKVYNALKSKINAADLMSGKQTDVDYSSVENIIVAAKIKITDIQCNF